ncbi:MAG: metallophosphoesterase family protein [Gammaproteobacteria bacterium]|nr:metallophosphoesterase family protein [Gammaproteobacteria bacterium]
MPSIEFINQPDHHPYQEDTVLTGLLLKRTIAGHGQEYAGRPVTALIATQHDIIKLRTEYQLPALQAKRFIAQAIAQEKKLSVHHPDKSWFLYYSDDTPNQNIIIGNITPTLKVLEKLNISLCSEQSIDYLTQIIVLYLSVAAHHDRSLDLSLSNFGITQDKRIYYLDDDVYPHSGFMLLTDFIAKLLRSETKADTQHIKQLGTSIRDNILRYFKDEHWITVIAEELRSIYLSQQNEPLRQTLISSLYAHQQFNYQPPITAKTIALIADIHSNAPALDAALAYLKKKNVNDILVLGDVVGYGPHPMQCINILDNDTSFTIIRGNHDHAVASGNTGKGITSLAGWAIDWTVEKINEDARRWLNELPPFARTDNWLAVHGSPLDKTFFNAYVYPMTQTENLDNLASRNIQICFHGHTHIQKVYYRTKHQEFASEAKRQTLYNALSALICPGSVGQPRGGKPGVELAIINLETLELEYHRINYSLETTIKDMQTFHFPSALIERLQNGQ